LGCEQQGVHSPAQVENGAVVELDLRLPLGIGGEHVAVLHGDARSGGVGRGAPDENDTAFRDRQDADVLAERGNANADQQSRIP
jgi:hypothetical protein